MCCSTTTTHVASTQSMYLRALYKLRTMGFGGPWAQSAAPPRKSGTPQCPALLRPSQQLQHTQRHGVCRRTRHGPSKLANMAQPPAPTVPCIHATRGPDRRDASYTALLSLSPRLCNKSLTRASCGCRLLQVLSRWGPAGSARGVTSPRRPCNAFPPVSAPDARNNGYPVRGHHHTEDKRRKISLICRASCRDSRTPIRRGDGREASGEGQGRRQPNEDRESRQGPVSIHRDEEQELTRTDKESESWYHIRPSLQRTITLTWERKT